MKSVLLHLHIQWQSGHYFYKAKRLYTGKQIGDHVMMQILFKCNAGKLFFTTGIACQNPETIVIVYNKWDEPQ